MPTKVAKEATVQDLQKALSDAQLAIVADTRGLTVAELTNLRRRVQKAGGDVTIVKNTLVRVATKGNDQWAALESLLKGPTALVIGRDDYIGAAKALSDFSKEKRAVTVQIRGGVLNGEALDTAKVNAIANMPSREVLLAMLAQLLLSPITGFARVVDAVAKQKEGSAA